MSDKKLTFEDNETITIKKVNNGFVIHQNDGTIEELPSTDLIETNGYPEEDKKGLVTLLYMVAGWAGFVDEETEEIDADLKIDFGDMEKSTPTQKTNIKRQPNPSDVIMEAEMSETDIENPEDIREDADNESEQFIDDDDYEDGEEYLDEFNADTPDLPAGSDILDGSVRQGAGGGGDDEDDDDKKQQDSGRNINDSDSDDSDYYRDREPDYTSDDEGYNEDDDGDIPEDFHDEDSDGDAEDFDDGPDDGNEDNDWESDDSDYDDTQEEGNGYD